MFNQLQDAQLIATSGGALGPTAFEAEAITAAYEIGGIPHSINGIANSSAERHEWIDNYIQTYGTPEQLAEIAERDRINARHAEIWTQNLIDIGVLLPASNVNHSLGRRC